MVDYETLEQQYVQIPTELKVTKRWVCYDIEKNEAGEERKVPINAITGSYARSNDPRTWTTFQVAINGVVKYHLTGIGFMLGLDEATGNNFFGVDLDNHPDKKTGQKPMNNEEFASFCDNIINALDSYTEYSHSGEGIHIICKGTIPPGGNRKINSPVEIYDKVRFFTMTGKTIRNKPVADRTEEIKPIWEQFAKHETPVYEKPTVAYDDGSIDFGTGDTDTPKTYTPSYLSDEEILNLIRNSAQGPKFIALFSGNMSEYGNDHSAADIALVNILTFWCGGNIDQIDRIFRRSGLMREKWDRPTSGSTYGRILIEKSIAFTPNFYKPKTTSQQSVVYQKRNELINENGDLKTINEQGDPIYQVKQIFGKYYALTDTGNSERFYDYFGEDHFRYNVDNKQYMYWDGKTWLKDDKEFIKKYADIFIEEVLKKDLQDTLLKANQLEETGEIDEEGVDGTEEFDLEGLIKAQKKNIARVSNSAGKEAMLKELQHMHKIPVKNEEFNVNPFVLNTDSGIVNLHTGALMAHSKKEMLSKNTNTKVSFETPTTWLKFLHDVFKRKVPEETEEIIDTVQMLLGMGLTGRVNKDIMCILWGNGSNGKSTFVKTIKNVVGTYGVYANSDLLIKNNSSSQSTEFSLASLANARLLFLTETEENEKLSEKTIKKMLSGEEITAQHKFGALFAYEPTFTPIMSTNNKPIVRATDFGTWRRLMLIPFLNKFDGSNKDVDMPEKLKAESDKILGWMIQGNIRLEKEFNGLLPKPKCLEMELAGYKSDMDVINAFISERCTIFPEYESEFNVVYQTYKNWARDDNEYGMPKTKFKKELENRGFSFKKNANRGTMLLGLKLDIDTTGHDFSEDL